MKEEKKMFKLPRLLQIGLGLLLACTIFLYPFLQLNKNSVASADITSTKHVHQPNQSSKHPIKTDKKPVQTSTETEPVSANSENTKTAEPVNWLMPTGGAYPVIGPNDPIWVNVSKDQQRVYIMKGNELIYTMVCSSGLDTSPDTSTPVGTFYIQRERGTSFYNPSEKEGAKYWVSWKNHGEFLFHSVATDINGNVIQDEAIKLGQKASHGCIRLSVPDAKWIYDHIKYNTKVVIS